MSTLDAAWARRWIELASQAMTSHRIELIELDRAIGDGDHGENMARGFAAAAAKVAALTSPTVADVLQTTAATLMSTVGGAAGPLYGTAFLRASKVAGAGPLDAPGLVALVDAALEGLHARGKATTGEKTMVDAWAAALQAARAPDAAGGAADDVTAVLRAAAAGAAAGAKATEPMKATKGRASYLGERSIGHRDPGAESSALLLAAAVDAL